jgi:hypothetical protein
MKCTFSALKFTTNTWCIKSYNWLKNKFHCTIGLSVGMTAKIVKDKFGDKYTNDKTILTFVHVYMKTLFLDPKFKMDEI